MNEEINKLQLVIDRFLKNKKGVKVLEAGCGRNTHIYMGKNAYIVGIDISEEQLKNNLILNEKILGDIQSYNLPDSEFDIIICWNVLEHIAQPIKALKNFVNALKHDGIIVLALPNVLSVKGILTKFTPYWFHVWIYKNLLGYKLARNKDCEPFRTFLKFSIAPRFIKKFAYNNNLSMVYYSMYNCQMSEDTKLKKFLNIILNIPVFLIKVLSFKKIDTSLTNYIIVLKKAQ